MTTKISVIIPTRGRDHCLRTVLRDLNSQERPTGGFDVWVVDQNDEKLPNLEQECPALVLHHEAMAPLGSHAGRNHAIWSTEATICVFVDDDVRLPPGFVKAHADAHDLYAHSLTQVVCVAGRVVQPKDGYTEEQMVAMGELARYNKIFGRVSGNFIGYELGFVDHVHECNFSARTDALRRIGGFNEEFKGNAYFEGTDLALRFKKAGFKIMYRPDIVLTHLQEPSGGNRVVAKNKHTYWYMRNWGLLNSIHMNPVGLPIYGAYGLFYVVGKSIKNLDLKILVHGAKGWLEGLSYFVPGRRRLKLR